MPFSAPGLNDRGADPFSQTLPPNNCNGFGSSPNTTELCHSSNTRAGTLLKNFQHQSTLCNNCRCDIVKWPKNKL